MDGRDSVVPRWAAVLICLAALAWITLLVDGTAVGFLARWVQITLALVGVGLLVIAAVAWWVGRRRGHVFSSEAELAQLDEPADGTPVDPA